MHSNAQRRSTIHARLRTIAGVTLGAVLAIGPAVTFTATADAAEACPAVSFIGVRGSWEDAGTGTSASGSSYQSGGFGHQVSAIIEDLRLVHPDLPMNTYGIKYPASVTPAFEDASYLSSKDAGAKALIAEMNYQAAACPATSIWLAGHSQGADVMGQVLSTPTSNQLSTRAQQVLNGVILLGDPSYRTTERINSEMNTGKGAGLTARGRTTGSMDGWTGDSFTYGAIPLVRSYCYTDDLICQAGSTVDTGPHNSYNQDEALLRDAESFLWGFILSPQRLVNKQTLAQR
ncbi:cutinase family protein [Curtobacterium flaccumfaciens]|uniref:cutinase family protein n=1 Tax=Curtobacterium flaccumfaciens TaxID=2035 RepID=UPI001BDEEE8D|nr:cutinase family protein [Curtobacterium flaccumfaciens]MBT1631460.1 cutinase family protein [Curtobacterium flaccumfaciens pv. oortii]MCX2846768.1 cutinase family protein [Curtobacterium flaccumfaciens pv. oortii]